MLGCDAWISPLWRRHQDFPDLHPIFFQPSGATISTDLMLCDLNIRKAIYLLLFSTFRYTFSWIIHLHCMFYYWFQWQTWRAVEPISSTLQEYSFSMLGGQPLWFGLLKKALVVFRGRLCSCQGSCASASTTLVSQYWDNTKQQVSHWVGSAHTYSRHLMICSAVKKQNLIIFLKDLNWLWLHISFKILATVWGDWWLSLPMSLSDRPLIWADLGETLTMSSAVIWLHILLPFPALSAIFFPSPSCIKENNLALLE